MIMFTLIIYLLILGIVNRGVNASENGKFDIVKSHSYLAS